MQTSRLVYRGLTYYWRTNIAVVLGVATAVAVLSGALLVGDSVRGSLRDLVERRLGRTDQVILSSGFFRERLADGLRADPALRGSVRGIVPLVVTQGVVTEQETGRRVGRVQVYGVDSRFWAFHGVRGVEGPEERDAFVSASLAAELFGAAGANSGGTLLVRVQRPSDIPLESLHGRKDDLGRTLRVTLRRVVASSDMGEFSVDARQGDVRAVFVSLSRMQRELEVEGLVNAALVSSLSEAGGETIPRFEGTIRRVASLEDIGLKVRTLDARGFVEVTSDSGLLDERRATAVRQAISASGAQSQEVFTYLANGLRRGNRDVPYSLVTAMDLPALAPAAAASSDAAPPILLNVWAAAELDASVGDQVAMEYSVWEDPGQLVTHGTDFRVVGIVPVDGADRDLAPVYPGISDSPSLSDWDPPFPIDLRRIRPVDEAYWEKYRTTPKAFVPLEVGQRLWGSRYGAVTSVRVAPRVGLSLVEARAQLEERLRESIDPLALGIIVRDVRAQGLAASRGATDFGAYFIYFSFFLVVSALVLASLFFKLGIEQRVREVGLLRAVGFGPAAVRRLLTSEGLLLAVAGSALGMLGAIGYAALLMLALRTWWVDAVGTRALTLHVSASSLAAGAFGGIVAAVLCIWWTLRSLARMSERSLLAGELASDAPGVHGAPRPGRLFLTGRMVVAEVLTAAGLGFIAAASAGIVDEAGAFFSAGSLLLAASLCFASALLRRRPGHTLQGRGWPALSRLGMRSSTYRPGRSVLSMAVLASATFILVSVDAFRRGDINDVGLRSGVGGYSLMVESLLPIVHDPNTEAGRAALNLFDLDDASIEPFRLLPGDDASCLNLYEPTSPRILAPRDSFLAAGRFTFQASLAATDAERGNPWQLLHRTEADGAVPVIADANSMTYVLHRTLGEDIVIKRGAQQVRLRLVAALRDSIFQGELLMSQANFLRLFPEEEGYRLLLVETAPERVAVTGETFGRALSDIGADVTSTAVRLAGFHKVENTYLSTFQALGGLGLLLGTVGLAAVLLRNLLERRREFALLRAVGYARPHVLIMVLAENVVLMAGGLAAGVVCAAIAIAPGVADRGGRFPITIGAALLLFAVFVTGLLASVAATRTATRAPLLESLRSE